MDLPNKLTMKLTSQSSQVDSQCLCRGSDRITKGIDLGIGACGWTFFFFPGWWVFPKIGGKSTQHGENHGKPY